MSQAMFYVASRPGWPGYYASCVDEPQWIVDTGKTVAQWKRKGDTVTRVDAEEGKRGMAEFIAWRKEQRKP